MDKRGMVHPCSGISLGHKKEVPIHAIIRMDVINFTLNKQSKDHIVCDSIYMNVQLPEMVQLRDGASWPHL